MAEMLVFVTIVFTGLVAWFWVARPGTVRYRKKPVLTGSEREFFYRLREALPECQVCPQVAATALIEPSGMGKIRKAALAAVGGRRVDYAIFDEDMHLLAVVEINHKSRMTRADAAFDACFASAGIRTIRFQAKRLPSEGKIRSCVYPRTAAGRYPSARNAERNKEIEFRKTPWRNTIGAHI
ncbi:DUF2726 domain-containing protein [Herbaspirillum sp. HC18]|nr:DUF2726 domain-containing protein [Herbaspirillum sp. HC18]